MACFWVEDGGCSVARKWRWNENGFTPFSSPFSLSSFSSLQSEVKDGRAYAVSDKKCNKLYTPSRHGLTIDRLISATVVLANGTVVNASKNENTNLFWALRGGGSNVAIATEFRLRPVSICGHEGFIFYNTTTRGFNATALQDWQRWAWRSNQADGAYHSAALHLNSSESSGAKHDVTLSFSGVFPAAFNGTSIDENEVRRRISEIAVPDAVMAVPWLEAAVLHDSPTSNAAHAWLAGSGFVKPNKGNHDGLTPIEVLDDIASQLSRAPDTPSAWAFVAFDAMGGAVSSVAPSETVFPHRDATEYVQYYAGLTSNDTSEIETWEAEARPWLDKMKEAVEKATSGKYRNTPDRLVFGATLHNIDCICGAYLNDFS